MASHYDRISSQYATRPTPVVGPSRGGPFYDRDRRISYPVRPEPDFIDEEPLPPRLDEAYYPPHPPQEYPGLSRESRGEGWSRSSWPRQAPTYSHSSPTPPPVPAQYPQYYHEPRLATSPQWEDRARWENLADERNFDSSPGWSQARRDIPHRRIPRSTEHHRRDPVPISIGPAAFHPRNYNRSHTTERLAYNDRRATYYDHPISETAALIPNDSYRQPQVERAPPSPWETHTYRPEIIPSPQVSRPVAMHDHSRPRQESFGYVPQFPSGGSPHRSGEQGIRQGGHSRQESLQSVHSVGTVNRERTATGSLIGSRSAHSTPMASPIKTSRNRWDGSSDELEYSGDEPVSGIRHIGHALRQTVSGITRSRNGLKEIDGRRDMDARLLSGHTSHGDRGSFMLSRPPPRAAEPPQPLVRQAWDPSTDQFVPIVDNDTHTSRRPERGVTGSSSDVFAHTAHSNFLPQRHGNRVRHGPPVVRTNDGYSPSKDHVASSSAISHTTAAATNRQGVMSVHDLVSPAPVQPQTSSPFSRQTPTPLLLDEDKFQDTTSSRSKPTTAYHALSLDASPQRIARGRLPRPEDLAFDRQALPPPRAESVPGLDRRRSPSDEPSNVGYSQEATSEANTPEPEVDEARGGIEVQIADATDPSTKPSISLEPGERISEDGTMRILAPRPKAKEKDITEMLTAAVKLRRTFDTQSRDQRVNPILEDNLAKSDGQDQLVHSAKGNLVDETVNHVLTQFEEEHQMNIRAALATKLAEERELLAEKQQRLRDEYMILHRSWLDRCERLDALLKANDMQETLTQAGRTTRRSAALGDAVRSDLEMEQIIASLGNEDLTDPNHLAVRNVATIPDMISVEKGKVDYLFDDTNNEVDDPASFYDPRSGYLDWTPEEERIFYAKYAQFPKQFGIIAEFLPHKTAQQCVLYYYIHKKKLINFRNAIAAGTGKRRKGVRKAKGSALLADVAQADSRRPAGRGRRGRGGFAGRGRGGAPQSTEDNGDGDGRAKRRRVTETPKPSDLDEETDNARDISLLPPKKRRGRRPGPKPGISVDSPGQSPAPGGSEGTEPTSRRKPNSTTTYWSGSDRDVFMRLLSQYGKDFRRIAAALPNKTHVQVGNYYKNHNKELGLEKIALAAVNRLQTPLEQDCFVTVSREEASQSRTPMEEVATEQPFDRQVAEATSGVGVLTLEQQNGKPGQSVLRAPGSSRAVGKEPVIKVFNPFNFQPGAVNRPQGIIMTPNGQAAYTLDVVQQPAQPQDPQSTTSHGSAPMRFGQ